MSRHIYFTVHFGNTSDCGLLPDVYNLKIIPLCSFFQINAEFKRITTIPLHSKFFSQLDLHCDNLRKLFKRRGGQLGQKLRQIVAQIDDVSDVAITQLII